ncbi:hypothetical protein [Pseudoxanthomonas dokdonensis]|uniref:Lipoprotein n=1 Tax=Pseudoxanthomonas dokdonensis TaxID=344882 RepID=A0A0R0CET4_9GAMM|nr:hypothetical protein [Pseudoxanthomonas dokdonensis]KRG68281.1 hypothetical protein ABB29_13190 [Pseudoxanthomonas dokdonensis]
MRYPLSLLCAAGLLAACQPAAAPPPSEQAGAGPAAAAPAQVSAPPSRQALQPLFEHAPEAIAVLPIADFSLHQTDLPDDDFAFDRSWKADADAPGQLLAMLVLDDSNAVTAAAMRLGSSNDPQALAHCLQAPSAARAGDGDEVRIDGQPFRHFSAADAAMSHYRTMEAYRAVRNGYCVAIDLIVQGVRPDVYDPPRTAPFTADVASSRLQQALQAVRFTR